MEVYYSGNYGGGYHHREAAGRELRLNAAFSYGGYEWHIPSVYLCTKGMVLDICRKVPAEQLMEFYNRWPNGREIHLSKEQQNQLVLENPMSLNVSFEAVINGKCVRSSSMTGSKWHPFLQKECADLEEEWMNAYHLDRGSGWYLERVRFPSDRANKRSLATLSMTLSSQNEIHSCNKHFTCKPGCDPFKVIFKHPLTHEPYELHILSCVMEALDVGAFENTRKAGNSKTIYPRKYCELSCRISPNLIDGQHISIQDCSEGDNPYNEEKGIASSIGILSSSRGEGDVSYGISSLYHECSGEVEWYISVQIKAYEPKQIDLSKLL